MINYREKTRNKNITSTIAIILVSIFLQSFAKCIAEINTPVGISLRNELNMQNESREDSSKNLKTGMVKVPGANIYYEMQGKGPILLMISGGSGDAGSYNRVISYLTGKYTIVTYDRRGYVRSKPDDPNQALTIAEESDDIHYLLEALTRKPVCIFGSSIGAVIALDFASRFPEQARLTIAHEPPANYLTKDTASQNPQQNIQDILASQGAEEAMKEIASQAGVELSNIGTARSPDQLANARFFLQKEFPALAMYRFNFDELKSSMKLTKFVIGIGTSSQGNGMGYLGALAISDITGIPKVAFPGGHAGMSSQPEEFAGILLGTLAKFK